MAWASEEYIPNLSSSPKIFHTKLTPRKIVLFVSLDQHIIIYTYLHVSCKVSKKYKKQSWYMLVYIYIYTSGTLSPRQVPGVFL